MTWFDRMTPLYVVVDDDYVDRMKEVVAGLESAGMRVDAVLEEIGAVTGSVEPHQVPSIKDVPGVSSVSRQREFRVPSPEADLQ